MKKHKLHKFVSHYSETKQPREKGKSPKKKKSKYTKPSPNPKRWRQLREGATYHVSTTANRGENIFESDFFKELFILTMEQAKRNYGFELFEFCIMSNHLHFIIKPAHNTSLSAIMRWLLSVFATRWNKLMGLSGHVFRARFFSRIIESPQDYENVVEYIRQNPVKAVMVEKPVHWKYSSAWYNKHKKWCRKRWPGVLLSPSPAELTG